MDQDEQIVMFIGEIVTCPITPRDFQSVREVQQICVHSSQLWCIIRADMEAQPCGEELRSYQKAT